MELIYLKGEGYNGSKINNRTVQNSSQESRHNFLNKSALEEEERSADQVVTVIYS